MANSERNADVLDTSTRAGRFDRPHQILDVLIVGSGPAGLAAAIAGGQAGLTYRIIEKGTLANSIFRYPRDMVFFTTPELLEIGGLPFTTPYEKPTRVEALRYYRRVADKYRLCITFDEEVLTVAREPAAGGGPALFRTETVQKLTGPGAHYSRTAILATGYYDNPNRLGIPGEDLPHVSHYYSEPHPCFRKHVLVVGGRNSAAEAALDLYRSGASVTLVHRRSRLSESIKYWVRPDIINRIREGSITARFNTCVAEIRPETVLLASAAGREEIRADAVFLLTGYHPDLGLLRRAGIRIDENTLIPEHDPETLETNVDGLYLAGAVISGRDSSRVFIENGRFHGETVIRHICAKLAGSSR
jgi:thioredoxin reductase (NADPH)